MYRRASLRHLSWLNWIESVIQVGNGFVAVDFTHLVGPDHNLVSALKDRGHRVHFWGMSCQQEFLPKRVMSRGAPRLKTVCREQT